MSIKSNRDYRIGSKDFLIGYNNYHLYTFVHTPDNASVIQVDAIPYSTSGDGYNAIAKVNIDRTVGYVPGIGLKPFTAKSNYVKTVKLKRVIGEALAEKLEPGKRLKLDFGGLVPDTTWELIEHINLKYDLGLSEEDIYDDEIKSAICTIRFSKTSLAYVGFLPITIN